MLRDDEHTLCHELMDHEPVEAAKRLFYFAANVPTSYN